MNSVAPIASNRVYAREKCFNCSNFICKERSQWRLESRRSLFFSVFVCFVCCCCCFLLITIIFPWLVSLYSHCWPFTPREIFIYIDYLEIPSWNFGFLLAPPNDSLVGLFRFPISVLSGFIWERENKVESNGPRLHLDVTNRWSHCDYRPDRYSLLVLCFSTREIY